MLKGQKTGPTRDGIHVALTVALVLWGLITLDYHTGACFNPAVAIGQTFLQVNQLDNTNNWLSHYFYAYTGGPALGGILSGLFFLMHEQCHKDTEEHHHHHEHASSVRSNSHVASSDHGMDFDKSGSKDTGSYRGLAANNHARSSHSNTDHDNDDEDHSQSKGRRSSSGKNSSNNSDS